MSKKDTFESQAAGRDRQMTTKSENNYRDRISQIKAEIAKLDAIIDGLGE